MKKIMLITVFLSLSFVLSANGQQQSAAPRGDVSRGATQPQNQAFGGGRGFGRVAGEGTFGANSDQAQPQRATEMATLNAMPKGTLETAEIAKLLYIWEEEKLARDVYSALGELYQLPLFNNIARSEQTHMDQLAFLLDRYGLKTPSDQTPGVYQNPDIARAYEDFVGQGSRSLTDAFQVGIAIEEMDIQDLQEAIELSGNEDVKFVLNQLLMGSQNHLAAFQRQANRQ